MAILDADFARRLIDSMGCGLVAVDREGRVVAFSSAAQRLLGNPRGDARDALGCDCRELLAAEPSLARLLLDALGGRDLPSRAELVLESAADCVPRTIGFTLIPVHDAEGARCGAAVLFRDLTPYERMDEQARLRERLTALGQMAAGLAHEIRNPLAGMEVLAGLLKRRLGSRPEDRALVEELLGELRSVAATVTASLDFVKPVQLARAQLNGEKLLEEALAVARSRVPFSGSIERDYGEPLPALVADAEQLRAVVTDLIVNALESMQDAGGSEGHRLRLGLCTEEGVGAAPVVRVAGKETTSTRAGAFRELVFSIADSGGGVPEELRERIFYPFFTTKQRGSGIGLANAQKVVASHGGAIELEGGLGRGSTFRLRIPLEATP